MEIPKGVKILEIESFEKVKFIWETLNNINGLFDDYHKDNFGIFINKLRSQDTVWLEREDGNGLLYLTNVIPNLSATGHVVYWDKRLRGREEFTMDCLRWLMGVIPLEKVNLFLPAYALAARAFADRIGFKREGIIRRWSKSDGKLFDIFVFGITKEEAFDGTILRAGSAGISRSAHAGRSELLQQPAEHGSPADDSGASGGSEHPIP